MTLDSYSDLLNQNKTIFLLEKSWWDRWNLNPSEDHETIDNNCLIEKNTKKPKIDLIEDQDFVYVSQYVWNLLSEKYGGGPAVEIFVLEGLPQFDTVSLSISFIKNSYEDLREEPYVFHISAEITARRLKKYLAAKMDLNFDYIDLYQAIYIDFDGDVVECNCRILEDMLEYTLSELNLGNMNRLFFRENRLTQHYESPHRDLYLDMEDLDSDQCIHEVSSLQNEDASSTAGTMKMNISDQFEYFEPEQCQLAQTRWDTDEVRDYIQRQIQQEKVL